MMKKLFVMALTLITVGSLHAQEEEILWRQDITMLVVPREPLAIQVAQDISRRYPVLIVCYQTTRAAPILHAWNGKAWVGVSTNDYVNGTFFAHRPRHAVIVEDPTAPAPDILIPDGTWCDSGNRLSSTDTRAVIHLLGRYFDFPYRYWVQFARRYKYELEEINPALIHVPWVHYRGDQVLPALRARDFERDMDNWSTLEISSPEPLEPVVLEKPVDLPPAEVPAQEMTDAPVEMPADEPGEAPKNPITENDGKKHVEIIVNKEKPAEKSVSKIIIEINNPPAKPEVDPFSTHDIPAAEIILPAE